VLLACDTNPAPSAVTSNGVPAAPPRISET
jgi:hypothetical protein